MTQRIINDTFWTDSYIESLKPMEKLVFLYLITNPLCNIAWIYEITQKRMCYEIDIDTKSLWKALDKFQSDWKILLIKDWIFIKNFPKNQSINPNVTKWIQRVINNIPTAILSQMNIAFGSLWKPLEYLTILNYTLPNLTLLNSNESFPLIEKFIEEEIEMKEEKQNIDYKEEIKKIIEYWNWLLKNKYPITENLITEYTKIRNKYSKEDIKKSLTNYFDKAKEETYKQYRLSPHDFFKQKNGFIKFFNQ